MSRKDYEAAAKIIKRECRVVGRDDGVCQFNRSDVIAMFAELFKDDNPRFDRDRFIKACGSES